MKKWNTPALEEVAINETAHNWTGIYRDGGYIGDGIVSGHLSWNKDSGCSSESTESTETIIYSHS